MRHERLGFQWNAQRSERSVDRGGEPRKIFGRFYSYPQHTRTANVWEKSQAAKFQMHRLVDMYFRERFANRGSPLQRDFANKFQSDMQVLRRNPTWRGISLLEFRKQRGQLLANVLWNGQRYKETHRLCPLRRSISVVQKINAHHIQCSLRSLQANHLAIAGKTRRAFTHASGTADGHVHRTDRLFVAPAAAPRDSRNADSQRAADAAANSVGHTDGHLRTYRAFSCDHFRRHRRPRP